MDNKLRKGVEAIPSTHYPHFAIFSKPLDMTEINYWLMKSERDKLLLGSQGIVNFYPNFTQTLLIHNL